MNKLLLALLVSISAVGLTACGGGGGDSGGTTNVGSSGGAGSSSFTIGGSISGLAGQVTLLNNGSDPLIATSNSSFVFPQSIVGGGSYSVTIGTQPTGQTCTVSSGSGAGIASNISNVVVMCSANTYTIGGSASGLTGQVTLLNNGSDPLSVSSNGGFTFTTPVADSSSYSVTVRTQPTGQTCTVSSGYGASVNGNISNISIICSTNTYTVSGNISGLSGQLTLFNNLSDAKTVTSNGAFSFSTPVAGGGSYSATVGTQPRSQACSITNASGTGVNANISNITVSCSAVCNTTLTGVLASNTTYALAGSPYCVSGNFQIPTGVTATFNSGTAITGGSIIVQGSLAINGTSSSAVNLTGVSIIPAGLIATPHSININYANIQDGQLYAPDGNARYGSLNLTNSVITNLQSYIYLWYPVGANSVSGNLFTGSGGISYGIDFRDSLPPSLEITNNYFSGWTGGYAIENWASYGAGSTLIQNNVFATTTSIATRLPSGYSSAVMSSTSNYWGTVDASVIQSMIFDKNDDIRSNGYINYTPFLLSIPAGTPTP